MPPPSVAGGKAILQVSIGNKHDQALADAHRLEFAYRVDARTADYLRVTLCSRAQSAVFDGAQTLRAVRRKLGHRLAARSTAVDGFGKGAIRHRPRPHQGERQ